MRGKNQPINAAKIADNIKHMNKSFIEWLQYTSKKRLVKIKGIYTVLPLKRIIVRP